MFNNLILVGFPPVVVPLAHENVRRYLNKESELKDKESLILIDTDVIPFAVSYIGQRAKRSISLVVYIAVVFKGKCWY